MSTTSNSAGARTGDLVRGRRDERDQETVEGVLHLVHVAVLNYVQVNVLPPDGRRLYPVDPASVVVLQPGVVDQDELDDELPIRDDHGWEPITDLDDAVRRGLVHPMREREGGTWADMHAALDSLVLPLLQQGWQDTDAGQEAYGDGDMVWRDFERDGILLDVQRNEAGWVDVYRGEPSPDPEDPEPPILVLDNPTPTQLAAELAALGPLQPIESSPEVD
jgi:hypothetical protein